MDDQIRSGMAEATRLTREGKLLEATDLIQRALGAARPPVNPPDGPPPPSQDVIEGDFRVVEDAGTARGARILLPGVAGARPQNTESAPGSRRTGTVQSPPPPRRHRAAPAASPPAREEVGRFLTLSYASAAGSRSYKLYVPSGYRGQEVPLLVMLHGCTQSADDFAAGTRMNGLAEDQTFLVAYPEQAERANGARCWNWFETAHQGRDAGEPSIIAGITRAVMEQFHVAPRRVYVAGMSAGGAMAAVMAATYPDLYAAVGIHSGIPYGSARTFRDAFRAMRGDAPEDGVRRMAETGHMPTRAIPAIVFHGDRDQTVSPANADRLVEQWTRTDPEGDRLRVTAQPGRVRGGHGYTRSVYHDVDGRAVLEKWTIHGAGHAWSGGSPAGTFTDARGPDASGEMMRFFRGHGHV